MRSLYPAYEISSDAIRIQKTKPFRRIVAANYADDANRSSPDTGTDCGVHAVPTERTPGIAPVRGRDGINREVACGRHPRTDVGPSLASGAGQRSTVY